MMKHKTNDDGTISVALKVPVVHDKKTHGEIRIRATATVQDLEAMDVAKGDVGKSLHLIAELTGLPLAMLRKLSAVDYSAMSVVVADILGNEYPGTGETS